MIDGLWSAIGGGLGMIAVCAVVLYLMRHRR